MGEIETARPRRLPLLGLYQNRRYRRRPASSPTTRGRCSRPPYCSTTPPATPNTSPMPNCWPRLATTTSSRIFVSNYSGEQFRILKDGKRWFNAIMVRGFLELNKVEKQRHLHAGHPQIARPTPGSTPAMPRRGSSSSNSAETRLPITPATFSTRVPLSNFMPNSQ